MKIKDLFILLFAAFFMTYCSSSQQTSEQAEGAQDSSEVYVFDAIESADSVTTDAESMGNEAEEVGQTTEMPVENVSSAVETVEFFIVQVGAFSSDDRAKRFIEENKSKIEYDMTSHFSDDVSLYVVQLPPFRTREKAEEVRNHLWTLPAFKDSFIVPK